MKREVKGKNQTPFHVLLSRTKLLKAGLFRLQANLPSGGPSKGGNENVVILLLYKVVI